MQTKVQPIQLVTPLVLQLIHRPHTLLNTAPALQPPLLPATLQASTLLLLNRLTSLRFIALSTAPAHLLLSLLTNQRLTLRNTVLLLLSLLTSLLLTQRHTPQATVLAPLQAIALLSWPVRLLLR